MNLRQAQRSLAELMSKCEETHIQLPKDPFEARAEAVEAIIHALKNQKVNLDDAQDELQQKFGLELAWKQHLEDEEAKRQRRRQKKATTRGPVPTRVAALKSQLSPPEAPPQDEVNLLESDNVAQGRKHKTTQGGVMTPAKRPAPSQGYVATRVVARKVKRSRELLLTPSDLEEKAPPQLAFAAHGQGQDVGNNGESESSGSPHQSLDDLLELGDLGDVGGSSDEDFTLD